MNIKNCFLCAKFGTKDCHCKYVFSKSSICMFLPGMIPYFSLYKGKYNVQQKNHNIIYYIYI